MMEVVWVPVETRGRFDLMDLGEFKK